MMKAKLGGGKKFKAAWVVAGLMLATVVSARVVPAPLFVDHAVLQRGKPVPVWGRAMPDERVAVSFRGQRVETTADRDGRWQVTLAPMAASTEPAELKIEGENTIVLRDVVVGEVWLCSGQSNMEMLVARVQNAEAELATAELPLLRHFKVGRAVKDFPSETADGAWVVSTPTTARSFSATAFFFGREIQAALNVPVGLIHASWGGSQIEGWLSDAALADRKLAFVRERWAEVVKSYPARQARYEKLRAAYEAEEAAAKQAGVSWAKKPPTPPVGPGHRYQPAGLFNGMIHPFVPAALRGVLWYQGEANAQRHAEYGLLFAAMIQDWRRAFGQGELPFYFVQLANYYAREPDGDTWAFQREAQASVLTLPATGMAVTIDIGDEKDVHPRNKQDVGRRLALLAKARIYGFADVVDQGPVFQRAKQEGRNLRLEFAPAKSGLVLREGKSGATGFQVAGKDRVFHPAKAVIEGNTLVVSSEAVPRPLEVRYAWANTPVVTLFNEAGLPAAPFRSDRW